jgi:hypothetical protein
MPIDDQIDDALGRLPVWTPPPAFTRRVTSRALSASLERPAVESRMRAWLRVAVQGACAAGIAYVASGLVDDYLRLTTAAVQQMAMQPLSVAWTCAALSLVTAAYTCRNLFSRI